MTRFSLRAFLGHLSGFRRLDSARRRDEGEDGPGVPVPTGPRPRRGGAQAQPPRQEEEALVTPPRRG